MFKINWETQLIIDGMHAINISMSRDTINATIETINESLKTETGLSFALS